MVKCTNPECNGKVHRKDNLIEFSTRMEKLDDCLLDIGYGDSIQVEAYICRACGEVRFFKETK